MKHLELLKTESAISLIKEKFSSELSRQLHLTKVSSPLVVLDGTGINDDLNGIERPVLFPIKSQPARHAVVVQSLAKWKRMRLAELGIEEGKGLLTDMRALRPDEEYTPLHSIYVDQWDWEKHIDAKDRTIAYLKETVRKIYAAFKTTEAEVEKCFPEITSILPDQIKFIHAEELLKLHPDLTIKEREDEIARKYGAVFIIGIGSKLSDGKPHDGRAPDYDDWSSVNEDGYRGLNGDLILWHPTLQRAFEVSSMGIRVDKEALIRQLDERGCSDRSSLLFHSKLLSGELPQSIGGGIGQSRVCMFMLRKKHIGEVQVSIWPEEEKQKLDKVGVMLL
ncbi:MAG: aspartate--ammonia ligase [Flammeovirgaceae bacterium]|nr:aspartate--ammonia ligase [Flammeovirgaceae bacterium]